MITPQQCPTLDCLRYIYKDNENLCTDCTHFGPPGNPLREAFDELVAIAPLLQTYDSAKLARILRRLIRRILLERHELNIGAEDPD
jgi:hypothetical protein